MTDPTRLDVHVVNATAFEAGKIYLIEYDRTKIEGQAMSHLLEWLHKQGVTAVLVRSINGHAIRVVVDVDEASGT